VSVLRRLFGIIATTANAMQSDRKMCLEAGMDDTLGKSVGVDRLVKALLRVQPRTGTRHEPAGH